MRSNNSYLDNLIYLFILIVLCCAGIAIFYYRSIFSGDLSKDAQSWGAFGSYIGGVIGPVVSFITLIAIVRTIQIQRLLLKTQQEEFSNVLTVQNSQLELAKTVSEQEQIASYKSTILNMVSQQITYYENISNQSEKAAEILNHIGKTVKPSDALSTLKEAGDKKDVALKRMYGLNNFAFDFSITQHKSMREVQEYLAINLLKAFKE